MSQFFAKKLNQYLSYINLLYIQIKPDARPIWWSLQIESMSYGSKVYVSGKFGYSHLTMIECHGHKIMWQKKLSENMYVNFGLRPIFAIGKMWNRRAIQGIGILSEKLQTHKIHAFISLKVFRYVQHLQRKLWRKTLYPASKNIF